nr:Gfo/Idh/MocA family oxidoreductase [uncultured Sediminibacterium sp.]
MSHFTEMKVTRQLSRRRFINTIGMAGLAIPTWGLAENPVFSDIKQTSMDQPKKLGIALVGLGAYATGQLGPALLETNNCQLKGIVTGSPSKIPAWKAKYKLPDTHIYSYDNFEQIKDNPDIDIIYIVLPNSMHAEYTIRAFAAGKHVICEKPMAITVADCDRMIEASKKANKSLSIGYRLHFEPYNLEMVRLGTSKIYGRIKQISGGFGFKPKMGEWRLVKKYAGGGPLMDVGIYAVQSMCYTTGMEPIAVTAKEGKKTDLSRFSEVEQSLSWQFEFPDGLIGKGYASYDDNMNFLKAEAERGVFELTTAYNYNGLSGKTPQGIMHFPQVNQQAKQMDAIAQSIMNNQPSIVTGEMGRRDVIYLQAIYEAMHSGKRIELNIH